MATIKAPVATFNGSVGSVQFADGEAVTNDKAVIAYCKAAGYTIGPNPPTTAKAVADKKGPSNEKTADPSNPTK